MEDLSAGDRMRAREETAVRSSGKLTAGSIGPRGIALLRTIRASGGTYRCERNADRDAVGRCAAGGYVHVEPRDRDILHITDDGIAFLDRLVRAH